VLLPVDESTAQNIERTCGLWKMLRRRVEPAGLAAMCLAAVVAVVVGVLFDSGRGVALLAAVGLVQSVARLVTSISVMQSQSRHHPTLSRRYLLIRDVDGRAAAAWRALNPDAGMELLIRGQPPPSRGASGRQVTREAG
jgi:hypothetical protein